MRENFRILKNAVTPTKYKIQTNYHPNNSLNNSWVDCLERAEDVGNTFIDSLVIRDSIKDAEEAISMLIYKINADTWTVIDNKEIE